MFLVQSINTECFDFLRAIYNYAGNEFVVNKKELSPEVVLLK